MDDKGFLIQNMLSEVEASLTIPPLKKTTQLSKEDTEKTQAICSSEDFVRGQYAELRSITFGIELFR